MGLIISSGCFVSFNLCSKLSFIVKDLYLRSQDHLSNLSGSCKVFEQQILAETYAIYSHIKSKIVTLLLKIQEKKKIYQS